MSLAEKTKIVICDDHPIIRDALRIMLESRSDFKIVAESEECEDILSILKDNQVDILILDLSLRATSGIEILHRIRQLALKTKVVIFSMHEDESYVQQALLAGAQAYLPKDISCKELVQALQHVVSSGTFILKRHEHLKYCSEKVENYSSKDCALEHPLDKLSKREQQVFFMLVEGQPNRMIAKTLFLSPRTVETHRARLIKKLGLKTTADLVRYAIKNKLHGI